MRSLAVSLLTLCLCGPGLRAQGQANARPDARKPAPFNEAVSGYGTTRANAEEMAFETARARIIAYLRRSDPALRWLPSAAYLSKAGMVTEVSHTKDVPTSSGPLHEVKVRAVVTHDDIKEIQSRDRRERVGERHLLSAKVLLALLLLLAVVAEYFKLEELTRGYYTLRLRALLVVCLGLLGVGVWLIL
jgi:hypothetical protein